MTGDGDFKGVVMGILFLELIKELLGCCFVFPTSFKKEELVLNSKGGALEEEPSLTWSEWWCHIG